MASFRIVNDIVSRSEFRSAFNQNISLDLSIEDDVKNLQRIAQSAVSKERITESTSVLSTEVTISEIENVTDMELFLLNPTTNMRKIIVPLFNNSTTVHVMTPTDLFEIRGDSVLELLYDTASEKWSKISSGGVYRPSDPQTAIVLTEATNGNSLYGSSVSMDGKGDTVVIGAPGYNSNNGKVTVYKRVDNTWILTQTIIPNTTISQHGSSVAISHDSKYIVIGSPTAVSNQGQVRVYVLNNDTYELQDTLSDVTASTAQQGISVTISSDGMYLVVGGSQYNSSIGAVWVYIRDGETWSRQSKLTPTDAIGQSLYGTSVSVNSSGSVLCVGGPNDNSGNGAVWVYQRFGEVWRNHTKVSQSIALRFGQSVHMDPEGSQFITGAPQTLSNLGAAFVYIKSGETWLKHITLGISESSSSFGSAVYLNSNTAFVGGSTYNISDGALWKFIRTGTIWDASSIRIDIPDTLIGTFKSFGSSISSNISSDRIIIGAPGHNSQQGAAVIYY